MLISNFSIRIFLKNINTSIMLSSNIKHGQSSILQIIITILHRIRIIKHIPRMNSIKLLIFQQIISISAIIIHLITHTNLFTIFLRYFNRFRRRFHSPYFTAKMSKCIACKSATCSDVCNIFPSLKR